MPELRIDYLNHASLLVHLEDVRLLFDPWLEGTAFSGGWGLRYANPDGLEAAARATHLWISHWHSDHLHAPTLKKLARRNPSIEVLANVSANFSMVERMKGLGFARVRAIEERRPFALADGVTCCRYPTAGIDNMLHVRSGNWSLLNYNDCNLPAGAIRALRSHIGDIDVLCTNYNHAGKLFDRNTDQARKAQLVDVLRRTTDALSPTWVVPFASNHYYRSEDSADQNRSLLEFGDLDELAARDTRYVVTRIGDSVRFAGHAPRVEARTPPLAPQPSETHDYGASVDWTRLQQQVSVRCETLARRFFLATRWLLPELVVRVRDHGRLLRLSGTGRVREASPGQKPHIEAHSQAVHLWLARRFGDDAFVAGAHFSVMDDDTRAIERWALATLLEASHLDPRSCLDYLRSREGRRFLYNRREELVATVLGQRWQAGRVRL